MPRVLKNCAVWTSLALAGAAAGQTQFRAVWADAFSVGFKSESQIQDMVARAGAGNYNALIVEVLAFHDRTGSGHGAYWDSSIVPRATDVSGGIDPLQRVIDVAHAAGLEVHAWLVPYRVCSSWPPSGNSYLAAHPEHLMVPQADMGGGPATVGGYFTLDPGSTEAQQYLVSIVQEIVGAYAIDGVNLDYIRYVQTDAGYPADAGYARSSLQRFRDLTGYVGTPAPTGVTSWNNFRRQTITELVRRLRAEIASIPNASQPLRFSADLICFGNAPTSFSSSDAYLLHQNWKLWMESGYLDMGIPMNYKREHIAAQATWYRNWVDAAIGWSGDRHIVAGQANYLNTKANSVTQMAYAINAGTDGTCNFSYDATADENTNGTPETDWTWYSYVATNLFTTPAATPPMPWRDPSQASEGTLWGRVIDDTTGAAVDGANVSVSGQPPTQTDGNGYYVVTLIPATAGGASYSVSASSDLCSAVNAPSVVVTAGGITRHDFTLCPTFAGPGDMDADGDIDFNDFNLLLFCHQGPDNTYAGGSFCLNGDADFDDDIDLDDLAAFQLVYPQ